MPAPLKFDVFAEITKAARDLRKVSDHLKNVAKAVDNVDGKKANVKVGATTAKATADLKGVEKAVDKLDGKKANVTVETNVDKAAKDFRALMSRYEDIEGRKFLINIAVAGGPAVVGTLTAAAGAAGGLASAFAAAGAGLGAFGLVAAQTFKDVSDQQKALKKIEERREKVLARLKEAQDDYAQSGNKSKGALDRMRDAEAELGKLQKERKAIMAQMGPEQRQFMQALSATGQLWEKTTKSLQPLVFKVGTEGLSAAASLMPHIQKMAKSAGEGLVQVIRDTHEWFNTAEFGKFTTFVARNASPTIERFGKIMINLGRIVTNSVMAFEPLGTTTVNGLVRLTNRWADMSATMSQKQGFQEFVKFAQRAGPAIIDTLESLARVFGILAKSLLAMAPLYLGIIKGLADITSALLSLHPAVANTLVGLITLSALFRGLARPVHTLLIALRALWSSMLLSKERIGLAVLWLRMYAVDTLRAAAASTRMSAANLVGAGSMTTLTGSTTAATGALARMRVAMLGVLKFAGFAAAVVGSVIALDKMRKSAEGTVQTTSALRKSMEELARTGRLTGAFFDQFRPGTFEAPNALNAFYKSANQIVNPSFKQKWVDHPAAEFLKFISMNTVSTPLQDATNKFKALDTTLVNMAKNGQAQEASTAFRRISNELAQAGISGERLKTLFPQFTAQFGTASTASAALTTELQRQKTALDNLYNPGIQVWNLTAQLKGGFRTLSASLLAAKGNFTGNSAAATQLALNFSTQLDTVRDLHHAMQAKTGDEAAAKAETSRYINVLYAMAGQNTKARAQVDALSQSLLGVKGRTQISKAEFIALATKLTGSRVEAERLWKEMKKIPGNKNVDFTANTKDFDGKFGRLLTKMETLRNGVTIPVTYRQRGPGLEKISPLMRRKEKGGIDRFRRGGFHKMQGGGSLQAHFASAPTVLFGERQTGGEAFIPLGRGNRQRSEEVLAETARLFGKKVVPMADGGILGGAGTGANAQVNLSEILSSFRDTTKPATKGDVTSALQSRRRATDQLKDAEAALRRARKSDSADRIASSERRVRREREELAIATSKLRSVEQRYQITKQSPITQLGGALGTQMKSNAAFIKNLRTLSDRGFGGLAQQLLAMGGSADSRKLAADAVKLSGTRLKALQTQITTVGQQEQTLKTLPAEFAAKSAAALAAQTNLAALQASMGIVAQKPIGMAAGGTIGAHVSSSPTVLYGERGAEAYIPLSGNRSRAEAILTEVARMFGGSYVKGAMGMQAGGVTGGANADAAQAGGQAGVNEQLGTGTEVTAGLTEAMRALREEKRLAIAVDTDSLAQLRLSTAATTVDTTRRVAWTAADRSKATQLGRTTAATRTDTSALRSAGAATDATRSKTVAMRGELTRTQGQLSRTAGAASNLTGKYRAIPSAVKTAIAVRASGSYTIKDLGKAFASGGAVFGPGTETSDSIPAWLSNKEYVISAAAHREYGTGMLNQINARRYAKGGSEANFGGGVPFDAMPGQVRTGLNFERQQAIKWTAKYTAKYIREMLKGPGGVVKAAASMIGKGDDRGENNNWLTRKWGMPSAPWCAMFVSEAIRMARAQRFYPGYPSAAVSSFVGAMKHVPTGSGQPGDLGAYRGTGHINVIAGRAGSGYITIGGNEGPRVRKGTRGGQSSILRPRGFAMGGAADRDAFREVNFDPNDRTDPLVQLYRRLPKRQAWAVAGAFSRRREVEARANGGPVLPGRRYLVGERGPELFTPGSSGRVEPGGNTVHLTIENFNARDGADVDMLSGRLSFAIRSASFG